MYLRFSRRSLRPSIYAGVLAASASILSLAVATSALAQSATELPPLEVETDAKKKIKKKSTDVTNTRLSGTGNAPAKTGAGSGAEATGGIGEQVSDGGGITGASTSVITREQIERAPQATLPDIIAREAGVQTTSLYGGVNGTGTKVDLRGFGAAGSSNTLVLIDGRRLNDWDLEGFDLSKIAKESIERIEITRGNSGAVLYGDGAVGGVINIVTRHGAGLPNQGRIEGGVGSFKSRQGNISASGSSGPFSAFVNGNAFESDQELRLPGPRFVSPAAGINQLRDDRRGTSTPLDYANKQDARGTLGFTYLLDSGVELIVDGGIRTKDQQAVLFSYSDTDLTTKSLTPRINITQPFFGLPSRAIAGIDFYDTDYDSDRGQAKGLAPYQVYHGGQTTLAGYWMQTVRVAPNTDISAGGRVQWNDTTAHDTFDASAPGAVSCFPPFGCSPNGVQGTPLDKDEINHAWHLGAEHEVFSGVTLFGRLAQSFRVANIDERIGSAPFGVPTNYDLRAQRSHDWETGARYQFGGFQIQSSYYDMRLTDELHFDPINFINTNLDPTRRRGVETIASWQVMRDVRLSGNLTYTDAVFRGGPNAGNEVPLVSSWTGNVGVSWDVIEKWLTFDTVVRYVGDRRMDNDQANFQPLIGSYTTVDVRLGGEIDQFFWSAGVANIFDVDYFDYSVASTSTFGTYNAYPQPGRTYMIKAGTNW
jgi:iron complex outermembrane receptor protein